MQPREEVTEAPQEEVSVEAKEPEGEEEAQTLGEDPETIGINAGNGDNKVIGSANVPRIDVIRTLQEVA